MKENYDGDETRIQRVKDIYVELGYKTAMDYHLCEHVTEKLSCSPESDYNLSCNEREAASQLDSLSDGLYAVELRLCCGLRHL